MSAVVVGLLFLTCGWKLYKDAIYTRYIALRNTGHPQYFGGALCAVLIFALSFSLDAFSSRFELYVDVTTTLLADVPSFAEGKNEDALRRFARILLWALPVTWILIRLLNLPFHRSPSLLMAAARKTRIIDELEETIYYCLRAKPQLSLALTTKNKKVYVGVPKRHSPDPDRDRVWIALWPLASGYRDDAGALHLTTFYDDVRNGGGKSRGLSDYQVVLPIADIQIAQAFDLLAYAEYQQRKYEQEQLSRTQAQLMKAGHFTQVNFGEYRAPVTAVADERHSPLFRIVAQLLPARDRYLLRMYVYFAVCTASAILLVPYSSFSLYLFAVAALACLEAIEPISVRAERTVRAWLERRRAAGEALEPA